MKILVINGSPRRVSAPDENLPRFIELPRPGGVTEPVPATSCCARLADAFIAGAREQGHDCSLYSLHDLRVEPCRACYGCLHTGKCVQRDGMQTLYGEFDTAEAVLFVSPLYYATIPAQMLAVINRLYPYWIDGIRYPELKGAGVIGVCADLGQSWTLFDQTWHSIFSEIGWRELGIVHAPRFMEHEEEYLAAARRFGGSFADGISPRSV